MPPAIAPLPRQDAALQAATQAAPAAADGYLSQISDGSLEILQRFGPEAPQKLNTYAVMVEDALLEALDNSIKQADQIQNYLQFIQHASAAMDVARREHQEMKAVLTDPTELAAYVEHVFGPDGPWPVQTPGEEARADLEAGLVQRSGPLMGYRDARMGDMPMEQLYAQQQAQAAQQQQPALPPQAGTGFNRPQLPMPSPSQEAGGNINPRAVWNTWSQLMDSNPAEALRLMDQMPPDVLRAKVLFSEE